METLYLTENSRQIWFKQDIINELKKLPKNKPINKKSLLKYYQQKILPFHPCNISKHFGSIKNACRDANVRCDALYGNDHQKHMAKLNTVWNKNKIKKVVTKLFKEGKFNNIKSYVILAKGNKNIPSSDTIKNYFDKKSLHNSFKQIGIKNYQNHYWSNARIIKTLQTLYNHNGSFLKRDIPKKFLKQKKCCGSKLIKDRFGSLDKAAEYAGIKFKTFVCKRTTWGGIGKNETEILDSIEVSLGRKIIRQYNVDKYFVDGYDPVTNTVYEVDEICHRYSKQKDMIRQSNIEQLTDCSFIRIDDS